MNSATTDGTPFRTGALAARPGGDSLSQTLLKGMVSSNPLRRNKMYGGTAGGCGRHSVLMQLTDETDTFSASSALYMKIGSAVHEAVSDSLYAQGLLIFKEYRIKPPHWLNLGGYVDNVFMWEGKVSLLEVKTCGGLPASPKIEHVRQAQVYSLITGIDQTFIFYVSRNVGMPIPKVTSFLVDTSDLTYVANNLVLGHLGMVHKFIPSIPADFRPSHSTCQYCPFKTRCWEDDEPYTPDGWSSLASPETLEEASLLLSELLDDDTRYARAERALAHMRGVKS